MVISKQQKKSLIIIAITVVLTVICKLIPFSAFTADEKISTLIESACYLVPYLVAGYGILVKSLKTLFRGQVLDENTLMLIATIGAFALGEAFEGVMVVTLYRIGLFFESYATDKSRRSIQELMDIMPEYATVIRDGEPVQVDPEEVQVGETLLIKAGERIPLDAAVTKGSATVNTASLTGESVPLTVGVGDKIISGSINEKGVIYATATAVYENSTVGKVLDLIENVGNTKAKTENFISRFSAVYTPIVVAIAFLIAVLPPLFSLGTFAEWIHRALTCLLVSCPCALVISVPLSFFGGMGCASKQGILIKGATYIEKLAKIKTILFDKTGTLTKGSFKVVAIHPEKISETELLRLAAAAESYSNHPISVSLISAYGKVPDDIEVTNIEELAGFGLKATALGERLLVGNDKLMKQFNIAYHECHMDGTAVHVALGDDYIGHIIISDEIKSGAHKTIMGLNKSKIKTVMLTGDLENTAKKVADDLGIKKYHAMLMPNNKVDIANQYIHSDTQKPVAFVGDGINDAPVILAADVGISMGAMGSDAAIEAADLVIMDDAIEKILTARKIAKRTMRIVKENIYVSIGIKLVVLVLSIVSTVPFELAEFADVGMLVLAVLNAARAGLPIIKK